MVLSEHSKDNQVQALYLTQHIAFKNIFGPKFVIFNLTLKNDIFMTFFYRSQKDPLKQDDDCWTQ